MKPDDVWVIVLAYHEQRHIAQVVERIRKAGYSNIVVVDDGSMDWTSEYALGAGAIVLRHLVNMRKGAAMKTGSEYALKQGAKALVYLDGDGQHAPEELPLFHRELEKGSAIVFGARKVTRGMPLVRRFGKILTGIAAKRLYGMEVHDVLSGYRALTARAYRKIRWNSQGYTVESEMVARAGKEKLRYSEITIQTIYHDRYKGVNVVHGLAIIAKMVWWRFFLR